MANSIWITGSGQQVFGTSLNKNQTDNFLNSGVGNTFTGIGGNINITGIASSGVPTDPASDSDTTIILTTGTHVTPPIKGVSDTFTLDGDANSLTNTTAKGTTPITSSTIKFTVLGNGGGNAVDLDDVSLSKITVAIGVDKTANAPAGGNVVFIDNSNEGGAGTATNTVSVGGSGNLVELNGDATNKVTFTSGGNEAVIGFSDDDFIGFGNKSTVTFAGTGNVLIGGDENFTVSGSAGSSTVAIGDGNNVVTMGGTNNTVSVWGGNNNINAGGSGATVTILGLDGDDAPAFVADPDDAPVPSSPTDNVTIAGTGDSVTATYENVNVSGTGVTGPTTITLGDGNNSVVLGDNALGNSAGGSTVTVGNGANTINVTGNGSTINVGDGPNGVTLSGNNNTVNVTDPTGVGQDKVQLGAGKGDTVNLDHAGGSVTDTGTGTTTVNQTGPNAVKVSLGAGTGLIMLGDGNDTVTANGNNTSVTAGNGNDTVTANGNKDTISLGNGNDKVTANGNNDTDTFGNGNNTVTANGNNDTFTFGDGSNKLTANGNNDTGTFASAADPGGNNTLTAKGSGDTWTFFENPNATVKATLGSNDSLTQTGGALNAALAGDGDTVTATNVGLPGEAGGTTINAEGNNETLDWTNSGGTINLNPSSSGDTLTFNGVSDDYAGKVQITSLTGADPNVDLEGLFNTSGMAINSDATFLSSLTSNGTGETLHLLGGGSIAFTATNSFDLAKFTFSA
jgi:hypothetical protein